MGITTGILRVAITPSGEGGSEIQEASEEKDQQDANDEAE